jgi:hypothetical protein
MGGSGGACAATKSDGGGGPQVEMPSAMHF